MSAVIGMSCIARLVYDQEDPTDMWNALMTRLDANPGDADALMDLSTLLQALGQRSNGLEVQKAAIEQQTIFRKVHGTGKALRVTAFVTAGDMMANTPIDFLLQGSDFTLYFVYVDAHTSRLPDLPICDVAFLAIGESGDTLPVLQNMAGLLRDWQGPVVLNAAPETIATMTRNSVNARFANEPGIFAPAVICATRSEIELMHNRRHAEGYVTFMPDEDFAASPWAMKHLQTDAFHESGPSPETIAFPLIIRPVGTHAGTGMEKIESGADLKRYLETHSQAKFYLSPFIDYGSKDGLFRKQRIVFINGRAYPSHYAVSEHWMVHYLSAAMIENAERRQEEATWMQTFDTDFSKRHANAFAALYKNIGLDYFGIDCAEMPDGRLLLFEADVAMIVHDMDSAEIFPYKKPAMQKLFKAFQTMLGHAATT